jgi:Family of unknown function (DUF6069)
MSTTRTAIPATAPARPWGIPPRRRRTRVLAVLGAAAASLAVWAIADPLTGVELRVHVGSGFQHVGPAMVIAASVLAGLAAWAVLAVLERFTPRARAVWTPNTLIALALSLAGPLSSGATTGAKLALAGMHVATAVVLVTALPGRKVSR